MLLESELDISDPRDKKAYFIEATTTRRILTPMIQALFTFIGSQQVKGLENLPASGPVVLCANHLTNFDVFPLQFALPRLIFYMGKAELFEHPIMDALLRHLGGFPVYRGERDSWAMKHAAKVLENQQVLGIFPEGTRSKGRGLRVGKPGAARLAIDAQCPIVPVAITGTHRLFKHFPRRTRVVIDIGKPICVVAHDSPLALTDKIMYTLAAMLPPELRGAYSDVAHGFEGDISD